MPSKKNPFKFKLIELNKKILKTFFYDLGFYILTAVLFVIFAIFIRNKVTSLTQSLDFTALFSNNIESINQSLQSLQQVFLFLVLFILVCVILGIILFTFFKGLIWLKLLNKKFSWKFFRKYLALNLIYLIPVLIIILFIAFKFQNALLTTIFILIFLHFHVLMSYFITKENKIKNAFKQAFKLGINIKYFFASYLLVIAAFIILSFILSIIPYNSVKPLINLVIYVFYFAVSRNYIKNLIQTIV